MSLTATPYSTARCLKFVSRCPGPPVGASTFRGYEVFGPGGMAGSLGSAESLNRNRSVMPVSSSTRIACLRYRRQRERDAACSLAADCARSRACSPELSKKVTSPRSTRTPLIGSVKGFVHLAFHKWCCPDVDVTGDSDDCSMAGKKDAAREQVPPGFNHGQASGSQKDRHLYRGYLLNRTTDISSGSPA